MLEMCLLAQSSALVCIYRKQNWTNWVSTACTWWCVVYIVSATTYFTEPYMKKNSRTDCCHHMNTQTTHTHTHLSSLYLLLSCCAMCLCFALVVLDHAYSWLCSRLGLLVLYSVLCPVFSLSLVRSLGCVVLFHLAVLMFALLLVLDVLCSTSNTHTHSASVSSRTYGHHIGYVYTAMKKIWP